MDKKTDSAESKPERGEDRKYYTRRLMPRTLADERVTEELEPELSPEPETIPEAEPEVVLEAKPEVVPEAESIPAADPAAMTEAKPVSVPGSGEKQEKDKKTNKWWIILPILAVIAIIVILLLRGCQTKPEEAEGAGGMVWDTNAQEGGLTYRSAEEIQAELNEKVAQGMINISMNTAPVFEDGTSPGNLLIVNSETNNYPQIVSIVLKDTGEEIYRSGGIPIGSKIEYAPLSVDLDPGTYACVAYFSNADPETGELLGTAGAEITITVLN